MGRLVFAAAALHPGFQKCIGIELLQGIHEAAEETLERCSLVALPGVYDSSPSDILEEDEFTGSTPSPALPRRPIIPTISDQDWFSQLQSQFSAGEADSVETSEPATPGDNATEIAQDPRGGEETNIDRNSSDVVYGLVCPPDETKVPDCDCPSTQRVLPLAPIEFVCGSFADPFVNFTGADCVFVFASAFPSEIMASLSRSIGTKCKPGTIVITIDKMLDLEGLVEPTEEEESKASNLPRGPFELELLEKIDGWCWLTGGASTAFVHRVVDSLWEQQLNITVISLEEKAFQVVKALESGELADSKSFLRGVYNNMVFHGLPESWWPRIF
jgi:hypothetical protein